MILLALLGERTLAASTDAVMADFVRDPVSWFRIDARRALELAPAVLDDPKSSLVTRRAVLLTVGSIRFEHGDIVGARAAFLQSLNQEPWVVVSWRGLPRTAWVLFSHMRDSLCEARLKQQKTGVAEGPVRTIAIGDVRGSSFFKNSPYDMNAFGIGLANALAEDIFRATDLIIVERQHLDLLQHEIGLGQGPMEDPRLRVRSGELYGAQSFLFGDVTQIDKDRFRIDAWWDRTSTSEMLARDHAEAKLGSSAEIFALEKHLMLDLIVPEMKGVMKGDGERDIEQKLEKYLDRKKPTVPSGNRYAQYLCAVGSALRDESDGKDAAALEAWTAAAKLNPADSTARIHVETLRASALIHKS